MSTFIIPDWPAPEKVVAATTTRATPDPELPPGITFLNQVHGATVVPVAAVRASDQAPEADAMIGGKAGDVCAVRTADCLPVLFCARDGREIAAAHAGWRGLAAGVLENTVTAMATRPDQLMAWIGPAISKPHFEVGEEVREAFVARDPAARTGKSTGTLAGRSRRTGAPAPRPRRRHGDLRRSVVYLRRPRSVLFLSAGFRMRPSRLVYPLEIALLTSILRPSTAIGPGRTQSSTSNVFRGRGPRGNPCEWIN